MKRRTRIMASAGCGLAAGVLAWALFSSLEAEVDRARTEALAAYGDDVVTVVVAARDLEPGEVAGSSNTALEEWAAELLPAGAVTSLDDLASVEVTSRVPEGAPLASAYFEEARGAVEVPAGRVAVSIPVQASFAVGGALTQGESVGAYVSKDGVADLLVSDARVVDASVFGSGDAEGLSWVTLAVDPDQAEELMAAADKGVVSLVVPGKGVTLGAESEEADAEAKDEDKAKDDKKDEDDEREPAASGRERA